MNKTLLNNKYFQVSFFIFSLILTLEVFSWTNNRKDPAVRLLPENASNVKVRDCSSFTNILFVVKAKMSEEDFQEYVDSLGFVPVPDRLKENLHWFNSLYDKGIIFETYLSWWHP